MRLDQRPFLRPFLEKNVDCLLVGENAKIGLAEKFELNTSSYRFFLWAFRKAINRCNLTNGIKVIACQSNT